MAKVKTDNPLKLVERQVTQQIRDYLKAKGWRPIRMQRTVIPGQFQTGEAGIADYLFLHYLKPGIAAALWVELKAPAGRLSGKQVEWIEAERERGASVWVVADFQAFAQAYAENFSFLHDGRLEGQIEMFGA